MFFVIGILGALAIFGPGWYRDRHPRPQVHLENMGSSALSVVHDGETSGVEAGKSLEFRCEVGKSFELTAPGAPGKRSIFVEVPAAADKQVLTVEARVDGDGVISASWKKP
jgi:hypothetical protein